MNDIPYIHNFLAFNSSQIQSNKINTNDNDKSYLLALNSLANNDEWIKNKPLRDQIVSRLYEVDCDNDEICEKIVIIYRKILASDTPQLLEEQGVVNVKLSQDQTVEIPIKLLMMESPVFYELLNGNIDSTLDLSESASLATNQIFVDYLMTGKIEKIPNENILELLLLAKDYKLTELANKCLEQAFQIEVPQENLTDRELELNNLIREAKENKISFEGGRIKLQSNYERETALHHTGLQTESLKSLNDFIPIKHLKVVDFIDSEELLSFVQHNPELISLDLSEAMFIKNPGDILATLAPYLPHLEHLSISNSSITEIPQSICNTLKELDCSRCTSLKKIDLPNATKLNCNKCLSLREVKIPVVEELDCQECQRIIDLDAPSATRVNCSLCYYIETINAPLATSINCSHNYYLKTIDAPSVTDLNCSHCNTLKTLDARSLITLNCSHCPKIHSLAANNAVDVDCSYCPELMVLEANTAKEIKCHHCNHLEMFEGDAALTMDCSYCPLLKTFTAVSAKDINCSNCTILRKFNAPAATSINCDFCPCLGELNSKYIIILYASDCISMKGLILPAAEYVNCSNGIALETLEIPNVKDLNCNGCRILTSIYAPVAVSVNCAYCIELETLISPFATKINFRECSTLITVDMPELQLVYINKSKYPKLILNPNQEDFLKYFSSLEINPDAYQLGGSIDTPPAPALSLNYIWEPESSPVIVKEIIDDFIDNIKGNAFKNGGVTYSKEQLTEGLQNLVTYIQLPETPEEIKSQLSKLLEAIYDSFSQNLQENEASIIRLAVAGLENDKEHLENDLQLIYSLDQLTKLFDSINFTEKDNPGYFNPTSLKDDEEVSISIQEVRKGLIKIFDHVRNRKGYIGTPPESPIDNHSQLRLYYNNLGLFLNHIAFNLQQSDDLEEIGRHLIDLGIAGNHCGERWIGDAEQIYDLTSKNDLSSIPDHIFAQDKKLRTGIVEKLSTYDNVIAVHLYNQYKRLIGEEFGIPGSGALKGVDDVFEDPYLTKDIAKKNFVYYYRVDSCMYNQKDFLDSLYANPKTKDNFMEFIKEMIPEQWVDTHYGPLLEKIKVMEENNEPRNAIREMLSKEDHWIRPDWNAQTAIKVHLSHMEQHYKNTRPSKQESPEEYQQHEKNFAQVKQEIEELKLQLNNLTTEKQKELLIAKGIDLGRETNPDFANELRLTVIIPEYLESLMVKTVDGYPSNKLTYKAIGQILEYVSKIRVKS